MDKGGFAFTPKGSNGGRRVIVAAARASASCGCEPASTVHASGDLSEAAAGGRPAGRGSDQAVCCPSLPEWARDPRAPEMLATGTRAVRRRIEKQARRNDNAGRQEGRTSATAASGRGLSPQEAADLDFSIIFFKKEMLWVDLMVDWSATTPASPPTTACALLLCPPNLSPVIRSACFSSSRTHGIFNPGDPTVREEVLSYRYIGYFYLFYLLVAT